MALRRYRRPEPNTLAALVEQWEAKREELDREGAFVRAADFLARRLAELRAAWSTSEGDLLNLTQAAAESGYSSDHLGRLLRSGKLTNFGRRGAPRIRRADLPRRPAGRPLTCSTGGAAYDPATDARTLWSRPHKGGSPDG